jgi:predicted transcriptional regulator of viral defense system
MLCTVTLEDRVLIDLHRAASLAGRPGIVVPSHDLEATSGRLSNQRARDALKRLVQSGRALSVRQDLVVLPDATGRVPIGVPELIEVVAPTLHLITGGRALEHHGLTDQHSFTVIVLVPRPVASFSFRGEKAVFLETRAARIWGWSRNGPHYATPERAVLDAVSHPRYGVSLSMGIGSLHAAAERDPKFLSRLAEATRRDNSSTAARRVGLIVERIFGEDLAAPYLELIGSSRTPVVLRAGGQRTGPVDQKWRVNVNASIELEQARA